MKREADYKEYLYTAPQTFEKLLPEHLAIETFGQQIIISHSLGEGVRGEFYSSP